MQSPARLVQRGVFGILVIVFVYVVWLSNSSSRNTVSTLRSTSAGIRYSQYKQQELLNRIEYRLAKTAVKYGELKRSFGEEFATSLQQQGKQDAVHTPYQATLQKASEALQDADVETAMDMLKKTNHELLDQLNSIQQKRSGNSSAIRKTKAQLKEQVGWVDIGGVGACHDFNNTKSTALTTNTCIACSTPFRISGKRRSTLLTC